MLHEPQKFLAWVSLLTSKLHELLCARTYKAAFRNTGHGHASSTLELENSLITQLMEGPENGVGVHAQDGSEVLCGREPLSSTRFTIGKRSSYLSRDLLMKRALVGTVNRKI